MAQPAYTTAQAANASPYATAHTSTYQQYTSYPPYSSYAQYANYPPSSTQPTSAPYPPSHAYPGHAAGWESYPTAESSGHVPATPTAAPPPPPPDTDAAPPLPSDPEPSASSAAPADAPPGTSAPPLPTDPPPVPYDPYQPYPAAPQAPYQPHYSYHTASNSYHQQSYTPGAPSYPSYYPPQSSAPWYTPPPQHQQPPPASYAPPTYSQAPPSQYHPLPRPQENHALNAQGPSAALDGRPPSSSVYAPPPPLPPPAARAPPSSAAAPYSAASATSSSVGSPAFTPSHPRGSKWGGFGPPVPQPHGQAVPANTHAAAPMVIKPQGKSQQPGAKAKANEYPESLKEWIRRGFFACKTAQDREAIQKAFKPIIQAAVADGCMWSRDWDTYPLPDVLSHARPPSPRAKRGRSEPSLPSPPGRGKAAKSSSSRNAPPDGRLSKKQARMSRFAYSTPPSADIFDAEDDWDAGDLVIQGTCTEIEKSYLRLTSAPNPALVRPEPVLERALERLVTLIRNGERDYFYTWSQFKAIRQDMTVQRIRNALTVRVYEAHARAALEYGDVKEYNNCATQLGLLYDAGCGGCVAEFGAYRILAACVQARCEAENTLRALKTTLAPSLGLADTPEVRHAMAVRAALESHNWVAFWRLYYTTPHLGRAILSQGLRQLRFAIINLLVKGWRQTLDMAMCVKALGFLTPEGVEDPGAAVAEPLPGARERNVLGDAYPTDDAAEAAEACLACLLEHGAVCVPVVAGEPRGAMALDCKASAGKIVMPEDKRAVAHGDANFSVDDFLSKVQRV